MGAGLPRTESPGALKAVTLDATYSLHITEDGGSITPGKLANSTILADNPVTLDPMKIKDIKVWGIVQEGRVLPARRSGVGMMIDPLSDIALFAPVSAAMPE